MKFSESWLRKIIDIPVSTAVLAEQLTMAGLEVESVTSCSAHLSNILVAKVVKSTTHSDSDKLLICEIEIGGKELKTVVCGADNVKSGSHYPYAGPGASLPGGLLIKERVIKGVRSEGMLCSEKELGLGESASGIFELDDDAKPGMDIKDFLDLNDNIIELSLTPNRGDCLSINGIAREVAVLNNQQLNLESGHPISNEIPDERKIKINSSEACPRYCGRVISGINAELTAPVWIKERLRRADIRSINVVVDLTNYVMLESGQPMHAFDNDRLKGNISIRFAKAKESITLLDGQHYDLTDNTLVIADGSGAIAMAGIMGGESTAVSATTKTIFLESAFFTPLSIMGRARQYGLHTDASHRFERGVDPELAVPALEKITRLLISICGGEPGPVIHTSIDKYLPVPKSVILRSSRITRVLGETIPDKRISEILQRLGFSVTQNEDEWLVTIPTSRFDISVEADLIEEIARINGYQDIRSEMPHVNTNMGAVNDVNLRNQVMARTLASLGYLEVITYSFVDPVVQSMMLEKTTDIALMNPISSDMGVMRKSLWPGLIQVLCNNIKRQQQRIRLFEAGNVFIASDNPPERYLFSGLIYGNIFPEQWDIETRLSDFYDLKSDVEAILQPFLEVRELHYRVATNIALHPQQSSEISYNNQKIGVIGAIHPTILRKLDIFVPAYLFELNMSAISSKKGIFYTKFSKYPSIRRDISIVIDEKIPVYDVMNCIKMAQSELLHNLELFDVYQGEGIDLGKKSLALGLTFQRSSSTLTDEEADIAIRNILNLLKKQFGATLRE